MTDKLKELLWGIHSKLTQREMPSEQALAVIADRIESALSEPAVEAAEIEVRISAFLEHAEHIHQSTALHGALKLLNESRRVLAGANQQAGSGVPEGWRLVPIEASGDQAEVGCQEYMRVDDKAWRMHRSSMGHSYRAMVDAAPPPPSPAAKAGEA